MTDTPSRLLALGGLAAMAAAMGIGRFVYTPILPEMIEAAGWSKSAAGAVASANYVGYLVGAIVASRPSVAADPRRWLLVALSVSAVTTMAMAVSAAVPAAAAVRFFGGGASAFVIICASTLVLQRLQARGHGRLATAHFSGVGVGIAVSSVAVTALAAAGAEWPLLWLATGALALLALPLVARGIRAEGPDQSSGPDPASTPPMSPALKALIVAYGLFGFGYVITATFLVTMVRETPAIAGVEPWIWLIVGLSAVPSVGFWSWLGSRIGTTAAFALACLVLAAGVAVGVEWPSLAGVCLSAAVLGGTFMGITALGLTGARILSVGPSQRAIGQMTASFAVGQAVGPVVAGILVDHTDSFRGATLLAAATLVAAAILSARAGARRRPATQAGMRRD